MNKSSRKKQVSLFQQLKYLFVKPTKLPSWPTHILPKSDEICIETLGSAIYEKWKTYTVDITVKENGQSSTVLLYDNHCYICSRDDFLYYDTIPKTLRYITPKHIKKDDSDLLKYCKSQSIVSKMLPFLRSRAGFALQFELCGPGIRDNVMGYKQLVGKIFNIVIISTSGARSYYNYRNIEYLSKKMGLVPVNVIEANFPFSKINSKKALKELARGRYPNGHNREGIVIRLSDEYKLNLREDFEEIKHFMASFKVANDNYII